MLDRHAAGKLRRAFTSDEYSTIVNRLELVKSGREKPNFNDMKMLRMYSIATYKDGSKYLVKPPASGSVETEAELLEAEKFLPIEKLYPLMSEAHLDTNHGKRDTLMRRLREMKIANAGRDTVLLFLSLCDQCVRDAKSQ